MIYRAADGMKLVGMENAIIVFDADLIRMHPPDRTYLQEGDGAN